ncbi:endoglucanase 15-like [Phoenix dactylifera]|uniref:Endoglucanase n=1 Tax=Phoenix dactylifera TaxID=42345 RepID=A0A8B7C6V9_PHODC|nr:endoglucanase 15-like [Phoenix dactylifera]
MALRSLLLVGLGFVLLGQAYAAVDYKQALHNSLLYFEAQRSGKLPPNQRVLWRGDSALKDGSDAGVDLTGGYYDAGDNVKFGFPMAFTITMLSWSAAEFGSQLRANGELQNNLAAIKWGTDYLIKAHHEPEVLYAEVGEGGSDHACWERPEDMTTPRTSYSVDASKPGSDIAGETAAALAAASIAFKGSDARYAATLLGHAKQLFDFARKYPGMYQNSIPVAGQFYSSSGYEDELLWAAAWLYQATGDRAYLDFLGSAQNNGGVRSMFSWDDKFVGVQTLVSKLILEGKVPNNGTWSQYKSNADQFMCNVVQKGNSNVKMSPAGMLWWQPWANFQYTTSAMLVLAAHADHLASAKASLSCSGGSLASKDMISFVRSQVDYILGKNPKGLSYMVGFGSNYPVKVHHRGASIISIKKNPSPVNCQQGFSDWYNKDAPNPNVLVGAIVGGPDATDGYSDDRNNYQQNEPATASIAPIVGVLASIA